MAQRHIERLLIFTFASILPKFVCMKERHWKIGRRVLVFGERTLVMGVLNVTPDSFSDGGQFLSPERAVERAAEMVSDGADIIDIGGESTRPGAERVTIEEEKSRVVPIIERLAASLTVALSIDTTKSAIARAAVAAGAEIINDISGLRFDPVLANVAAETGAGLVLMHSRGDARTMHSLEPVEDILTEVEESLRLSINIATERGVEREALAVDPGIGFSKSDRQNLELLARLDTFAQSFREFPVLIGTSRKSFLGRILDGASVEERLHATMATVTAAVLHGANIVRLHDVKAGVETVRVADAIKSAARSEQVV